MHRKGTAIITVLLASAVLLVVCLSLASLAMLNLNLAGNYSSKSQSLLIAEAAVSQLIAELDRAQQDDDSSGSTDPSLIKHVDLTARYALQPVFPVGAERFPGDVAITF